VISEFVMDSNWIEWSGGKKSPVHSNVRLDVKLFDGRVLINVSSVKHLFVYEKPTDRSIVAYRKSQKGE
jgi:hypothetical protein